MNPTFPFSVRLAATLISICLILTLTYLGQEIFIPVALAVMFAILLRPMVYFLQRKLRFSLVLAVSLSVIFGILVVAGLIFFISVQVGEIASDWVKIKENLMLHYSHLQQWVKESFGVSFRDQANYVDKATKDSMEGGKEMIGNTLSTFTGTLMNVILIPFYTFLILIYRNLFIVFILKLFHEVPQKKIHDVLLKIKMSVQSFLTGMLIEMCIVSALTTIGLMLIGMKYAILLGVITGVLNLIPYIGILIAALLTIVATLTNSAEITTILGVIIVNVVVQIIDNNILVPMVVSSKVKMNAFVSVIVIVIGGQLAGIAGMFLAIPLVAILKIIFDEVNWLEPWGYLIGDDVPKDTEWRKSEMPTIADAELAEKKNKLEEVKSGGFLSRLFGNK